MLKHFIKIGEHNELLYNIYRILTQLSEAGEPFAEIKKKKSIACKKKIIINYFGKLSISLSCVYILCNSLSIDITFTGKSKVVPPYAFADVFLV